MVTVTGDIGRESIVQISTTGESTITDFGNSCRKSQAAEILATIKHILFYFCYIAGYGSCLKSRTVTEKAASNGHIRS